MDGIEVSAPGSARPQSQSRISSVLLWALAAAAVFRIATGILDRPSHAGEGGGMVGWQPRERAAAIALVSRKPILYDFSAAWCGPCKLLDKDWEDPTIAETVNDGFVPARVIDRQREDGKNPADIDALQQRFEVSGFPTLVAASPDGRLIAKIEGYRGRAALVEFLKEAKKKPAASP
ncbi:MAG TPA: thioredoxin domain-containing protein [Thermoanaerobaculia bacterium]|jgi:thiol-disulfide isomerase/thioredoxin